MTIQSCDLDIVREPLLRPFAFKGGAFTEKWLTAVCLRTAEATGIGVGGLAILWSDPAVFGAHTETGGNLLMALVTEFAAQALVGTSPASPMEAVQTLLPQAHEYARNLTRLPELRRTFALNALVGVDNALWQLHAARHGLTTFNQLVPDFAKDALCARQHRLVRLPAITYSFDDARLAVLAESGCFLPKIKIGHPGTQEEMLARDCARLTELHAQVGCAPADYSDDGRLLYYLDANGRYESGDTLRRLLDHLDRIGMLDQILLIEEPFPEENQSEVGDLPVMIAADESLHDVDDVRRRISQGYGAMTLKAAGKTLSMTFAMAAAAHARGVPALVADSGCVPALLGWNLNVAARLPSLPGMSCGILESNGLESYRNWAELAHAHATCGAHFLSRDTTTFELGDAFHAGHAGILDPPKPYAAGVSA
ncbi:MAG: mandelate racemase/muconate lactonizing enzyme family protein [Victivallales bacterium]|nr:mandelate racemase/muconate lactonizing enzyme family protein [Victivallales bacterium]